MSKIFLSDTQLFQMSLEHLPSFELNTCFIWSCLNILYVTLKNKRTTLQQKNKKGGDNLLSHWASPAVPSASRDFTSVFGMGTGVALWLSSPPNKMVF